MQSTIVRLQEIEINNIKNVESGVVNFHNYSNIKKAKEPKGSDILGIYGQNGSGKTALVDSLNILKHVMSGDELSKNMLNIIRSNSNSATLKFTFLVETSGKKFLAYYEFEIKKIGKEKLLELSKEELSYSLLGDNKRNAKIKIIDYDIENTEPIFKPLVRYNEIISSNKENIIKLNVAKALANKSNTSFIFNDESIKIFEKGFNTSDYWDIIVALRDFARVDLFVIRGEQLGYININKLMPFNFRLQNQNNIISGDIGVALFQTSIVPNEVYDVLKKIIKQINIVIRAIVPGLNIDIVDYGKQLLEDGTEGLKIELVSVRGVEKIPLKYESEGIKKIISILSAMIAMYNNKSICLVVDELDAGVFEYLLGEILNILEENAKGQFIFTSHNLRALEKLNKECVVFTTTNPENRYIRLTNVKSNNNLRDFYLRGISLGGQKECIYEETDSFEINYAFKKAGRELDEN